ncbi:hypothetical protein BX600DRAFT_318347 [Xylariales sp. PMI_506]|nr:hypothetical protein BX600DRAFT_318347 [Xylariales sp. PMI_506]
MMHDLQTLETDLGEPCHLNRLPEELCLLIMDHLTPVDRQVLKRTCQRFLRLCQDPLDRTWPSTYNGFDDAAFVSLQMTLARDRRCYECQQLRQDQEAYEEGQKRVQAMMWCHGCSTNHPALFFSAQERIKDPQQRKCIGLQGHIRICAHMTVSWAHLQLMKAGKLPKRLRCAHESHITSEEKQRQRLGFHGRNRHEMNDNFQEFVQLTNVPYAEYSEKFGQHKLRIRTGATVLRCKTSQFFLDDLERATSRLTAQVDSALYTCTHDSARDSRLARLVNPACQCKESSIGEGVPKRSTTNCLCVSQNNGLSCLYEGCRHFLRWKTGYLDVGTSLDSRDLVCDFGVVSSSLFRLTSPTASTWLAALQPESYLGDGPNDTATKGLVWCDDRMCATMWRGLERQELFDRYTDNKDRGLPLFGFRESGKASVESF